MNTFERHEVDKIDDNDSIKDSNTSPNKEY